MGCPGAGGGSAGAWEPLTRLPLPAQLGAALGPGEPAVLTFVAIPHGVKVDVVLVAPQEEEAEPGVEGVDGDDEEQADDVTLLAGDGVGAQVQVDLGGRSKAGLGDMAHPPPKREEAERTSLGPALSGHSALGTCIHSRAHSFIHSFNENFPWGRGMGGSHGPLVDSTGLESSLAF